MEAITEDYVSFETAKLLKDKGFDEICYLGYNKNGEYVPTSNRTNSQIIQPDFCFICCPTLQMAMKWLRKIYHIHIRLINAIDESYKYEIYPREGKYISKCFTDRCYYETYEQACEAAIKYCLENLI